MHTANGWKWKTHWDTYSGANYPGCTISYLSSVRWNVAFFRICVNLLMRVFMHPLPTILNPNLNIPPGTWIENHSTTCRGRSLKYGEGPQSRYCMRERQLKNRPRFASGPPVNVRLRVNFSALLMGVEAAQGVNSRISYVIVQLPGKCPLKLARCWKRPSSQQVYINI